MAPWWLRAGNDDKIWEEEVRRSGDSESPPEAKSPETKPEAAAREQTAKQPLTATDAQPETERASTNDESKTSASPSEDDPSPEAAETREAESEDAPPAKKRRRRRRRKPSRKPQENGESTPARAEETAREPAATLPEPSPAIELEVAAPSEALNRSVIYSVPDRQPIADERKIAMFCDFENIALGVRASEIAKLDVHLILARLLEKGKIIVKKAYADWERYSDYKKPFHEAAIELIDIPQKYYSGKNSADIRMVVDAMDLCYSKEHLDTFVLVSGDSDFSPLVSKLKENNKSVIGVGVKNSSSSLLIDNCDEFIFYEDLWRDQQRAARLDNLSPKDAEVFGLLLDAMFALNRENKEVLWGSMIKQTMQRKRPSFNEGYYGYDSFSELLEDAQSKKVIHLKRDQRSGNYVVTSLENRR